jgi:hypothetical protein
MKRLTPRVNARLSGFGWYGFAGLGLLVFAAVFYFSTISPEKSQLAGMQQDIALLQQRVRTPDVVKPKTPVERIAVFYGFFPLPAALPDQLQKIFGVAEAQELQLEQGDYRVVNDTTGRLIRFQMTLPVKGTYPQIRKFVAGALTSVPALALNSIQFERKKVGDTTVEAKIRFVVFLGKRA